MPICQCILVELRTLAKDSCDFSLLDNRSLPSLANSLYLLHGVLRAARKQGCVITVQA